MYLIAGLGNPGLQYADTRHNVGFMLLDYLARVNNVSFAESKWKASIARTIICDETVILFKPETLMNASGTAVAAVSRYYKVPTDKIVVIHDDLDMPFARIKLVKGGGAGGHKGIRSIITHLGSKDFLRIKMGIGRPSVPIPPEKYVLSSFKPDEFERINQKMETVFRGIKIMIQKGTPAAMNELNQK